MVQYKRGLQQLRSSVLGDGLLERARAMSLALLGATAAVGLAIVALALNQGWPLVDGSGIPVAPPLHQHVGDATVAARSQPPARSRTADRRGSVGRSSGEAGSRGSGPAQSPAPVPSSELVITPASPAPAPERKPKPQNEHKPSQQSPARAEPDQQATPDQPARSPAPQPEASGPAPEPPAATNPPATASGAPEESNVPSWSNGKGHAYGREGRED